MHSPFHPVCFYTRFVCCTATDMHTIRDGGRLDCSVFSHAGREQFTAPSEMDVSSLPLLFAFHLLLSAHHRIIHLRVHPRRSVLHPCERRIHFVEISNGTHRGRMCFSVLVAPRTIPARVISFEKLSIGRRRRARLSSSLHNNAYYFLESRAAWRVRAHSSRGIPHRSGCIVCIVRSGARDLLSDEFHIALQRKEISDSLFLALYVCSCNAAK